MLRALKTAVKKLEEAGHKVVDLSPQLPSKTTLYEAMESGFTHFVMDNLKTALNNILKSGEPIVASIPTASMPELKHFQPSVDEVFRLNVERAGYQKLFRDLYVKNGLDAVVMPMYQATAVPHDKYGMPIYTVLGNLLDVSARPYQLRRIRELTNNSIRR